MVTRNEHSQRSQCPLACALDVFGDHWTLLIIRDMLILNKHEYKEFLDDSEGISSNILSDRLSRLEHNGLIASVPHADNKKRKIYYLTAKGKDLAPVIVYIGRWSFTHLEDRVVVPKIFKDTVTNNPEKMVQQLLNNTKQWEKDMGIKV